MSKWNTGDPPAVGWYEASIIQQPNRYRWWNGKYWSWAVARDLPMPEILSLANQKTITNMPIYWRKIKGAKYGDACVGTAEQGEQQTKKKNSRTRATIK